MGTSSNARWEQKKVAQLVKSWRNGCQQLESATSGATSILVTGGSRAEELVSATSVLLENEVPEKDCPDRVSQTCAGDD